MHINICVYICVQIYTYKYIHIYIYLSCWFIFVVCVYIVLGRWANSSSPTSHYLHVVLCLEMECHKMFSLQHQHVCWYCHCWDHIDGVIYKIGNYTLELLKYWLLSFLCSVSHDPCAIDPGSVIRCIRQGWPFQQSTDLHIVSSCVFLQWSPFSVEKKLLWWVVITAIVHDCKNKIVRVFQQSDWRARESLEDHTTQQT